MKSISSYQESVNNYKYVIILIALLSFILIPVHISIFPISSSLIIVINFTFIVLSGLSICQSLKNSYLYFIAGSLTILLLWVEFSYPDLIQIKLARFISSIVLFLLLDYILLRELIRDKSFTLKSILGAISGYLFLGLIGGVIFEIVYFLNPSSFIGMALERSYSFYYYSFIAITTVGFGDIVPTNPVSQSITILMTILGQFYLTVVVAVFVGKFLSRNFKNN